MCTLDIAQCGWSDLPNEGLLLASGIAPGAWQKGAGTPVLQQAPLAVACGRPLPRDAGAWRPMWSRLRNVSRSQLAARAQAARRFGDWLGAR
jgi:hypothetical protein